jgi:hypothetical protein
MKNLNALRRILIILLSNPTLIDFLIMTVKLDLLKISQQEISKETLQTTTYSLQL